jgi:PPOX class probable F420-dependent enzyme
VAGSDSSPNACRATLTSGQAKLFEDANVGVLGTLRKDGSMHLTPVWVGLEGSTILVNSAVDRLKVAHVRNDPRVSIVVVDRNDSTRYVSVTGTCEINEDTGHEHMLSQAQKYLGDPAALRAFDEVMEQSSEIRVVLRIEPQRITQWNIDD